MDVGCTLDFGLRLWAPTSTSHTISAVAEFLVFFVKVSNFRCYLSRTQHYYEDCFCTHHWDGKDECSTSTD